LPIGVWLGLLAVGLHAFSALLTPMLTRAAAAVPQAHDHAAPAHHHGAPDAAARDGPAAPDLVCVGDCPCCSLGDRAPLLPAALPVVLLPGDADAPCRSTTHAIPPVYRAGAHFPPRAPPVSA